MPQYEATLKERLFLQCGNKFGVADLGGLYSDQNEIVVTLTSWIRSSALGKYALVEIIGIKTDSCHSSIHSFLQEVFLSFFYVPATVLSSRKKGVDKSRFL